MSTKFKSKQSLDGSSGDLNDDPLSRALMPPKDESPEDKARRLHAMHEATRVSREIDESLQESRRAMERRKKAIKVLLLGASARIIVGLSVG